MTSSVMPSSGLLLSVTSAGASGVGAAVVGAALALSLDFAALSLPSDPQADATIAIAARMTMSRFNMKTSPLWIASLGSKVLCTSMFLTGFIESNAWLNSRE
jgi:hypothetical protein